MVCYEREQQYPAFSGRPLAHALGALAPGWPASALQLGGQRQPGARDAGCKLGVVRQRHGACLQLPGLGLLAMPQKGGSLLEWVLGIWCSAHVAAAPAACKSVIQTSQCSHKAR